MKGVLQKANLRNSDSGAQGGSIHSINKGSLLFLRPSEEFERTTIYSDFVTLQELNALMFNEFMLEWNKTPGNFTPVYDIGIKMLNKYRFMGVCMTNPSPEMSRTQMGGKNERQLSYQLCSKCPVENLWGPNVSVGDHLFLVGKMVQIFTPRVEFEIRNDVVIYADVPEVLWLYFSEECWVPQFTAVSHVNASLPLSSRAFSIRDLYGYFGIPIYVGVCMSPMGQSGAYGVKRIRTFDQISTDEEEIHGIPKGGLIDVVLRPI